MPHTLLIELTNPTWVKSKEIKNLILLILLFLCLVTTNAQAYRSATFEEAARDGVSLSTGLSLNLGLLDNGTLLGWGHLKNENQANEEPPFPLYDIKQVTVGDNHICVINANEVKCWGDNSFWQLDKPAELKNPKEIAAGSMHTCAIVDDDVPVKCWGINNSGQRNPPSNLKNPRKISAGAFHSCVLDGNEVRCWGNDDDGQITDAPKNLKNPRQIASGRLHSCVLDNDGVQCWGNNDFGQNNVPRKLKNPRQITAGGFFTCVLDDLGVQCWGDDRGGQITDAPQSLKNPRQITAGFFHACVLDDDGVQCWGRGKYDTTLKVPALLKNTYPSFVLFKLSESYLLLAYKFTYRYKSDFFNKLVQLVEQYPVKGNERAPENDIHVITRAFILNASEPLIKGIETTNVQEIIYPNFKLAQEQINSKLAISKLSDIPLSKDILYASLNMMRYAVSVTRSFISLPENRESLERLYTDLHHIIAEFDTLSLEEGHQKTLAALNREQQAIGALIMHPRTASFGQFMEYIKVYLEAF